MKRVIHIGDGRHIEIEEGELRKLPPTPKKKRPPYAHRPTPIGKPPVKTHRYQIKEIPGWHEWLGLRRKQIRPLITAGRRPNQAIGMTGKQADLNTAAAYKQALNDMAKIKASGVDLDASSEEALVTTLTIMRANKDVRVQLAAARQVLEWSKAKPAASTNVNVNTAEDWLASLSTEDDAK